MRFAAVLGCCLLVLSCASTENSKKTAETSLPPKPVLPQWTTPAFQEDANTEIFSVSGASSFSDINQAEKEALKSLKTLVISRFALESSSQPSALAQNTLQEYAASLENPLVLKGANVIPGLQLMQRFQSVYAGSLTIYLQFFYNRQEFNQEHEFLQELLDEPEDSVIDLEWQAEQALSGRYYYKALSLYLDAFSASYNSGILRGNQKAIRNFQKVLDLVGHFKLFVLNNPQTTMVGQPFAQPFAVQLVYQNLAAPVPVADFPLRFNYKAGPGKNDDYSGVTVNTNVQGVGTFNLEDVNNPLQGNIYVVYDLKALLLKLAPSYKTNFDYLTKLEDLLGQSRLVIPYEITEGPPSNLSQP